MEVPGRSYNSGASRWNFNGKEIIKEIRGWQDYGERMYNRLINRFPSPDPLIIKGQQYPELSPYQFASNRPIQYIDLDGLEGTDPAQIKGPEGSGRVVEANDNIQKPLQPVEPAGKKDEQPSALNAVIKEVKSWFSKLDQDAPRGKQPSGIVATSEFAAQNDGPETDATEGGTQNVDITGIWAIIAITKDVSGLEKLPDIKNAERLGPAEATNSVKGLVEAASEQWGNKNTKTKSVIYVSTQYIINQSSDTQSYAGMGFNGERYGPGDTAGKLVSTRDKNGKVIFDTMIINNPK